MLGEKLDRFSASIFENRRNTFLFFSLIVLLLTIYTAYVNTPLYIGHDTETHYNRLASLISALQDGNYPWYMSYEGTSDTGYFVKAFYADISLLPFALIGLVSSTYFAFVSMLFVLTLCTAWVTYIAVDKVYKCNKIAFVSAILYTFCSYRLLDVYHRMAIGEVFTMCCLPLVLWGGYEVIKGNYKKWYILTIAFSLIIFSHLISSVLTFIVFVIFAIFYIKRFINEPIRIAYLLLAGFVSLLLIACYLFPMLEQMASNTFYYEVGESIPGEMQYTLGVTQILGGFFQGVVSHLHLFKFNLKIGLVLGLAIFSGLFIRDRKGNVKRADYFVLAGLVVLFAVSKIFPWGWFPFSALSFMQYPWRLLMYASFFFAIAGGIYLATLIRTNRNLFLLVPILSVVNCLLISSEAQNCSYQLASSLGQDAKIENIEARHTRYGVGEYMPAKVVDNFNVNRGQIVADILERSGISNYRLLEGVATFSYNTEKTKTIELPLVYYLGYKAEQDGKQLNLQQSENGMVEITVPHSGEIKVYYSETTIQIVSTIVSLLVLLLLIGVVIVNKQKLKKI